MSRCHLIGQGDLPALLDQLTVVVTTLESFGVQNFTHLSVHVQGALPRCSNIHLVLANGEMIVTSQRPLLPDTSEMQTDWLTLVAHANQIMSGWGWSFVEAAQLFGCDLSRAELLLKPGGYPLGVTETQSVEAKVRCLIIVDMIRTIVASNFDDAYSWVNAPRAELEGKSLQQYLLENETYCIDTLVHAAGSTDRSSKKLH